MAATQYNDLADLRVSMGCVAAHATECADVWIDIGTTWAVADSLYTAARRSRVSEPEPLADEGVHYIHRNDTR